MTENHKKCENVEIREFFLHKSPSIRWFRNGIHSLPSRADAEGALT